MATLVTLRVQSHVKIKHATYNTEHVQSVNLDYMAITVIYRVPSTVMTTCVTHRMEYVLHVNLDGLEYTVKQVRMHITYYINIKVTDFFVYFVIINMISVISFCKHLFFFKLRVDLEHKKIIFAL